MIMKRPDIRLRIDPSFLKGLTAVAANRICLVHTMICKPLSKLLVDFDDFSSQSNSTRVHSCQHLFFSDASTVYVQLFHCVIAPVHLQTGVLHTDLSLFSTDL